MDKASATKYPKIFRDTYWGGQTMTDDDKDVIENRNIFVETLHILSPCTKNDLIFRFKEHFGNVVWMDHFEAYNAVLGRIVFIYTGDETFSDLEKGLLNSRRCVSLYSPRYPSKTMLFPSASDLRFAIAVDKRTNEVKRYVEIPIEDDAMEYLWGPKKLTHHLVRVLCFLNRTKKLLVCTISEML